MRNSETSTIMRLGLIDLPQEDAILIRTLLTLKPQGGALHWTLAENAPYDAMVVDVANRRRSKTARVLAQRKYPVLMLGGSQSPDNPHQLQRPIRAANLYAWLDTVPLLSRDSLLPPATSEPAPQKEEEEKNLDLVIPANELQGNTQSQSAMEKDKIITTRPGLFTPADFDPPPVGIQPGAVQAQPIAPQPKPLSMPPAPPLDYDLDIHIPVPLAMKAPLPMGMAPSMSPIAMPAAMPAHTPVAEALQASAATTSPEEAIRAEGATISETARYKLVRWPPPELMGKSQDRLRLASLLSRQALRVDELEVISQVQRQECRIFLQELLAQNLLDERKDLSVPDPVGIRAPGADQASPATGEAEPEEKSGWTLIKAFRHYLDR